MSICPICNGEGYVYEHITYQGQIEPTKIIREICYKCHGTGKVDEPQTNEEWRKTCSTEEFAEWMAQYCCDVNTSDVKEILKKEWQEWLKQPHREGDVK